MAPRSDQRSSRPPAHSRFQEGSMNDRTSAAPPVHFLDGSEMMRFHDGDSPGLLNSVSVPGSHVAAPPPFNTAPPGGGGGSSGHGVYSADMSTRGVRGGKIEKKVVLQKKSSRFLGQVWDGVSKKLGLKKGSDDAADHQADEENVQPPHSVQKDDILSSYHDLVASGFFKSQAIRSTRHAPPPLSPPPTAAITVAATAAAAVAGDISIPAPTAATESQPTSPPLWPLSNRQNPKPVETPALLLPRKPVGGGDSGAMGISRGTKRPFAEEKSNTALRSSMDHQPHPPISYPPSSSSSSPKKLRKLRSTTSSRFLSLKPSNSSLKLTKPPPFPPSGRAAAAVEPFIPERGSSARRTVSFGSPPSAGGGYSLRSRGGHAQGFSSGRSIRSRKGDMQSIDSALRAVPHVNKQAPPPVPVIPDKLTFGQDRENGEPWRGLRIGKRAERTEGKGV